MHGARASEGGRSRAPIFVVGPSRSGTTLLREILRNHPDLWVGPETHYFDDLRTRFRGRENAPLVGAERTECEDYFLALADRPYGRGGDPERATSISREALRERAAELGGSADAYFVAYHEIRAEQAGKRRWAEKTPRHVFRIDEIADLWPEAKVVCLVRDPRAVVASYRFWKRGGGPGGWQPQGERDEAWEADERRARRSYNVFVISMLWRAAMRASLAAVATHGDARVRTLRYEDFVANPEAELRTLTDWLELTYDPRLLDVAIHNSSFEVSDRGVSAAPLERWREHLPPADVHVIQTVCGRLMRELGYAPDPVRAPLHRVAWAWATVPTALLRAFVVNRKRLGNPVEYVLRRARLVAR